MMRKNQLTFVLAVIFSICGVYADHIVDISDNDVVTSIDDHRLHKFEEQKHIEDLIEWKDWKEQEAWKDYCKASETCKFIVLKMCDKYFVNNNLHVYALLVLTYSILIAFS